MTKNKQATAKELVDYLGISRQSLYKRNLPKLIKEGRIGKIGKPPRVFYFPIIKVKLDYNYLDEFEKNNKIKKELNKKYLIITPNGERKEGIEGFTYWCQKNNLSVIKTAKEYVKTLERYDRFRKEGLINGIKKLEETFEKIYLDELYYLDFYSIERFGKTRLGQLLLYAKQTQDIKMTKELIKEIEPVMIKLIKKHNIDGVGFVPYTIKREIQFMKELENGLNLNTKTIKITKVKTEVIVPQKSLSKLKDRIENVEKTLIVEEKAKYNNILLIDDAVGSGSTMNEIAKQIREKKICKGKIIGFSITGSYKGFDVISEV